MKEMKQIKKPKILIYNDENLEYKVGNYGIFNIINEPIEVTSRTDLFKKYVPGRTYQFVCDISNFEELDNIALDDTTMKRLAKFNKEIDIKRLDKQIEEKKKQIDELDNVLQDREDRVGKLKNFIKDIYNINLYEDDGDYDWDD